MKRYTIPNTDLEISQLGFGCGSLSIFWDDQPVGPEELAAAPGIMRMVSEMDINFFDIAASYAYGKCEVALGHALKEMPSLRDEIIIQSKCGIVLPKSMELVNPPPDDPYYLDSSRKHILASVEGSLKRLGIEYLDILLIHRPDILMEPDEVAAAFDELQTSGKVRYFGLSNFSPAQTEHLRRSLNQPIVTNQLRFGLGHPYLIADGFDFNRVGEKRTDAQYAGTDGAMEYFQQNDILVQAWSAFQGTFHDSRINDHPNRVARLVSALEDVAEKYATSSDAIALAWVLRHPANFVPIVGSRNPERLKYYVEAVDLKLERRDWYRLLYAACDQTDFAVHQG